MEKAEQEALDWLRARSRLANDMVEQSGESYAFENFTELEIRAFDSEGQPNEDLYEDFDELPAAEAAEQRRLLTQEILDAMNQRLGQVQQRVIELERWPSESETLVQIAYFEQEREDLTLLRDALAATLPAKKREA